MEPETSERCRKDWWKGQMHCHGCGGVIYAFGFIGTLVYCLQTATTVWAGLIGILEALFWPAFLVYEVLKYIGA